MVKEWDKDKIIEELILMYENGIPLNYGVLAGNSSLINAIYYKSPLTGKPKYFGSLTEAREIAATRLELQGRCEDAQKMREMWESLPYSRKISEAQWEKRRKELKQKLLEKLASGEDLSHRYQRKIDRTFVTSCDRAFGHYRDIFVSAGLDYGLFCRYRRKGKGGYLTKLFSLAFVSDCALDRTSVLKIDSKLVERLSHFFGGYYGALGIVHNLLKNNSDENLQGRADPAYWKKRAKENGENLLKTRRGRSLEKILEIFRDEVYEKLSIKDLSFDFPILGKDVWNYLTKSSRWICTSFLARCLDYEESNITKNVIWKFPERVVRYHEGNRERYRFHKSIIKDYRRKGVS